ncbi:MAG TPA: alpha/beta hydrolase [Pedobacter sp.]|uniref:alpha/beta hydrolase n=1 Tax=Pedobacter sp. TaxID=1411316 RepID=UPI002B5CD197|nr:alpha/beta hydrolase [Pedobacter sp.]HMI03572.1 alpha/beta hydrolase [Pedobacter sp.]
MKNLFLILILLVLKQQEAVAQNIIHLYQKVPNSVAADVAEKTDTSKTGRIMVRNVTEPTLTVFLPEKKLASGTAVIICPGGGYSFLVMNNEGTEVAKELTKHGIAAFVLKYRLPNDLIMKDRSIGPLQDAEQAIKLVRERAKEWGIDTAKVGIMGFSAGGHLASTASTHYSDIVVDSPDGTNLRPDFSILIYPVVSFQDGILHKGSKKALIGEDASREKTDAFSNELRVDKNTPPAFLIHCSDDKVVPVLNSIHYYEALKKNGVKAEMHIYATGGHGFGLNNATRTDKWMDLCLAWLREMKMN